MDVHLGFRFAVWFHYVTIVFHVVQLDQFAIVINLQLSDMWQNRWLICIQSLPIFVVMDSVRMIMLVDCRMMLKYF